MKRVSEKRVNGMAKRRRHAFVARAVFAAGVALALFLAVIGTQPRNAARLKRAVLPVISLITGQADASFTPSAQPDNANLDTVPDLFIGDEDV